MARVSNGTVLAGKYALVTKLGQGGMGSVWRAEHVQLRSPVAIKLIDEDIVAEPEALARFMREAQSAAALRSPHVVQILDFGADNGVPYIAMELLEGESLASRIQRTRGLPPLQTASFITQISRAIAKAHESGIVHRDLKPDNIFIVHNDEEEVAKVLDFGIAKAQRALDVTTGSNTRTGAILGTPYYMSPEQAEGNRHVDHRTDLWALGVIAFECLLGRRPFDSDALGSLLLAICTRPIPVPSSHGRVPRGFDAWFARACSRDLGARFQNARELAAELRRVCGATSRDSLDSPPVSIAPPTVREGSREEDPPSYNASGPTANTYPASIGVGKSRSGAVAWLMGGAVAAVAIAGGGAWIVKQRNDAAAADASASAPPALPVSAPAPVLATPAPRAKAPDPVPTVAVAPVPSDRSSAPAPATAPKVTSIRKSSPRPKLTATTAPAVEAAKPAPVAEPAKEPPPPPAPKPTPPPAPKPKDVNLGI